MLIKETEVQKIIITSAVIAVVIGATLLTLCMIKHQHAVQKS